MTQHTRLDLGHPDGGVNELPHQRTSECVNCVLGCAIDTTPSIRLYPSNGAEVNNMTRLPFLEIWKVMKRTKSG